MRGRSGPAIGLFGGSFNPAHAGHRHVADAGLRELQLDQVWWLVSPQNPLKSAQPSASDRAETIEALDLPYAMQVSHIETTLKTCYTVDLIRQLRTRYPMTRFVYMIGSDNLAQMPRWKDWQVLFDMVPIAVISRPGAPVKARLGQVARQMASSRIPEQQAHALKDCSAPSWTYLTLPLKPVSSSAIRATRTAN
jgi:nicotinate-nucleotide adenylyltransferase